MKNNKPVQAENPDFVDLQVQRANIKRAHKKISQ
jgi:hypothetical protein